MRYAGIEYTQPWGETTYATRIGPAGFEVLVNNREVCAATPGVRVVTDWEGRLQQVVGIDVLEHDAEIRWSGQTQQLRVRPNEVFELDPSGRFVAAPSTPFYFPDRPTIAPQGRFAFAEEPLAVSIMSDFPDAVVRYTTDGSERGEQSSVYERPLAIKDVCTLQARAFRPGAGASQTASVKLLAPLEPVAPEGAVPGLSYAVYAGNYTDWPRGHVTANKPTQVGPTPPEFGKSELLAQGVTDRLNLMVATDQKPGFFGVRFTGYIKVPSTGNYK